MLSFVETLPTYIGSMIKLHVVPLESAGIHSFETCLSLVSWLVVIINVNFYIQFLSFRRQFYDDLDSVILLSHRLKLLCKHLTLAFPFPPFI